MNCRNSALMALVSSVTLCALACTAPAGSDYDLSWHTIDGGGGTSTGGGFMLSGTIGQPDAGAMSGGSFTLVGGFWASAGDTPVTCAADIAPAPNGDGLIGPADLAELLASWGACANCAADFDGTGIVGPADLAAVLAAWGACP